MSAAARPPERGGLDFTRLVPGDLITTLAAVLLLFVLATDWYSTEQGDALRRVEQTAETDGSTSGEIGRKLQEEAEPAAERYEKNAWQADGALSRTILIVALLTIGLALGAALLRARGRRYPPPFTPSALVALFALLGIALIFARVADPPGSDTEATFRAGVWIGIASFALVAFGAGRSMRREARDPALAPGDPARPPAAHAGGGAAPPGDAAA